MSNADAMAINMYLKIDYHLTICRNYIHLKALIYLFLCAARTHLLASKCFLSRIEYSFGSHFPFSTKCAKPHFVCIRKPQRPKRIMCVKVVKKGLWPFLHFSALLPQIASGGFSNLPITGLNESSVIITNRTCGIHCALAVKMRRLHTEHSIIEMSFVQTSSLIVTVVSVMFALC